MAGDSWIGEPSIKGGSERVRMLLLTLIATGISLTWRTEMTYCTPYLLELGISKSGTSLVWLAGPFSGMVMQPIIGALSDASTSSWGRRRPFMVVGSTIVALSFLTLGFSRNIVGIFLPEGDFAKHAAAALAVASIWAIDLSVNAVMSCARSLVVDTLPIDRQQEGASWYNRFYATADVLGSTLGAIDLVSIFGTTLGDTQFKQASVLAASAILTTTLVTCWAVTERVLVPARHKERPSGFSAVAEALREIMATMRRLPPRVETICHVQFWAWLGWFPFLYYSSTWVGELYFKYDAPDHARNSPDVFGEMGRIGSSALMYYAIMSLLGAWLGPPLIQTPDDEAFERHKPASSGVLDRLKPDLLTVWVLGNMGFTAAMVFAPFAKGYVFATVLVGACGVPWTIHNWAPGSFLGVEVNRMSGGHGGAGAGSLRRRGSNASDIELAALSSPEHASPSDPAHEQGLELSGIYFGILNIYTTIPQVIGNMFCYLVFVLLEPTKAAEPVDGAPAPQKDGPNAIGVCFFIGALCTLQASRKTRRLRHLLPDGSLAAK